MFTAYASYRFLYPEGFAEGSRHMDLVLGGVNTGVLIVSSLTMALAVHAAQVGNRRALLALPGRDDPARAGLPGPQGPGVLAPLRRVAGARPATSPSTGRSRSQVELFFLFYFIMTGIHAVHLTIGVGVVSVLLVLAWRGNSRRRRTTRSR